jgi:hypothetical protein
MQSNETAGVSFQTLALRLRRCQTSSEFFCLSPMPSCESQRVLTIWTIRGTFTRVINSYTLIKMHTCANANTCTFMREGATSTFNAAQEEIFLCWSRSFHLNYATLPVAQAWVAAHAVALNAAALSSTSTAAAARQSSSELAVQQEHPP